MHLAFAIVYSPLTSGSLALWLSSAVFLTISVVCAARQWSPTLPADL
jgi:hypothetical protein